MDDELFEARIYRALLVPALIMGLPRSFAVLLGVLTLAMCVGAQQYYFVVLTIIIFAFFGGVTKDDPFFFDLIMEGLKIQDVME